MYQYWTHENYIAVTQKNIMIVAGNVRREEVLINPFDGDFGDGVGWGSEEWIVFFAIIPCEIVKKIGIAIQKII